MVIAGSHSEICRASHVVWYRMW